MKRVIYFLMIGFVLSFSKLINAANLTWDAGGASSSSPMQGSGTWTNGVGSNWSNGSADLIWNNGNNDTAIMGTGGMTGSYNLILGSNIVTGALTVSLPNPETSGVYNIVNSGSNIFSLVAPTVTVSNANGINLNVALSGNNGLTKCGIGNLVLNAAAIYTGNTIINAGNIYVNTVNALPTASQVTINSNSNRAIALFANQTIGSLNGSVTAGEVRARGNTTRTFTINTLSGVTGTYSGGLTQDAGSIMNLVVDGSGTQAISGTNSYGGTTVVKGGKLVLNSSLTASSAVTVMGGTLASGGNVTLGTGDVSMISGTISPGDSNSVATLTISNNHNFSMLGGTIKMTLGNSSDLILGSGSGLFNISGGTIDLDFGSGFSYLNTYILMNGFSGGSVSGLTANNYDMSNWQAQFDANSSPGQLKLTFLSIPEPSYFFLLMGGFAFLLLHYFENQRKESNRTPHSG
ncbi:MAG: autotransporter-associated beta strand repeat-containing protein [Verrucomicrobiota bacterium]